MKQIILLFSLFSLGQIISFQDIDTLHTSLWANFLHQSGKTQQAASWYKKLLTNATSLYSYQGLIHFLFSQKQFDAILSLIPTVDTIFANKTDIQKIFALSLYFSNQQDAALARLIALNKQVPQDADIAFITTQLLVQYNKPQEALSVINIALQGANRKPTDFMLYYLKGQILTTLSQFSEALEATKQSVALQSRFDKGWLLLAILQERAGHIEQAINGYTSFLDLSTENSPEIKQHLAQLIKNHGGTGIEKNVLHQSRYQKALTLQNRSDFSSAEHLLTANSKQNPLCDEELMLLIDILVAQKKYSPAIETISNKIRADQESSVWPSVLHLLLYSHAPIDELYNAFVTLEKQIPHHPWISIYATDLAIRQNNLDAALLYAQKGVLATKEPTVKAQLLFQQAMVLFEQRTFSNIPEILNQVLEITPQYIPALNLLAYYYAGKGKNIDRAWELFNRISADAHNPFIIDTNAYILYKQGKYAQAQALLKPIVDTGNSNATILIHYAKIEKAMGNSQTAKKLILQAKESAHYAYEQRLIQQLLEKWT